MYLNTNTYMIEPIFIWLPYQFNGIPAGMHAAHNGMYIFFPKSKILKDNEKKGQ